MDWELEENWPARGGWALVRDGGGAYCVIDLATLLDCVELLHAVQKFQKVRNTWHRGTLSLG